MDSTRNLRVASSAAFVAGFSANLMFAVSQPFVLQLDVPMSTLGLLESLGGRRGLAGALIQPVGGWLSDRFGFRAPSSPTGWAFWLP
ncbi:MAG: hypothetical protein JSW37_09565 [Anaerolineales bacterium]|nr:MAG: hypothetical protein JSW37_09565 [Anaerolineales bacterium]